ncbi:hypothetical protein F383_21648 [Gossypium arboreum]|uniref:Uncharacterized protein n=1 Tax=Gossypium arboreum TaxID=29729 RepID=A0A0B0NSK4_GOSAR|nr:hypothetical protein F383_21648 [Gossypium arboreum]
MCVRYLEYPIVFQVVQGET